MKPLLQITDLYVTIAGNSILNGLNLTVNPGEVHAIMGPNGSGKSTLANVIAGREEYQVESGSILYKGQDLFPIEVDECALAEFLLLSNTL
jgi:Fe-S cluster assembly ATP-binding protein